MLYADVIIKHRSQVEELTYAVPATMVPYIRSGSLVLAPVRRRVVPGVVVSLRRTIAKSLRPKVKNLHDIDRQSQLSSAEIEVLRELADYYGASLAEVAFHALDQRVTKSASDHKAYAFKATFIQSSTQSRFRAYCQLIKRYPRSTFLCVFAQRSFAEAFIAESASEGLNVLFDDRTVRFRKAAQTIVTTGHQLIVAGTSSSIFFPLEAGDGMIIDQPGHIGSKQQQRPYMRTATIARVRSKHELLRVVFGDDLIAVNDLPKLQRQEWQLISRPSRPVQLTVSSRLRFPNLLLPSVIDGLRTAVAAGERVLVLVLARGWASAYLCQNCGHLFRCGNCYQTLAVDNNFLVCRYDGTTYPIPQVCSDCDGQELREVGEGVARVRAEIERVLPAAKVTELSNDQPNLAPSGIIVATEKVLGFPLERFDSVICASIDRLLTGIELNDRWYLLKMLRTLSATTNNLQVQTFFPDDPIWSSVTGNPRRFFVGELSDRQRLSLPPFGVFFEVVGQGSNAKELSAEADRVAKLVKTQISSTIVGSPAISAKGSGRWRGSIFCSVKRLTVQQKRKLGQSLPPSWHLDIEPVG